MKRIAFTVNALAQPQGSMNAYKRGRHIVVTSANKKLKPFREQVTAAARVALFLAGYDGDEGPKSPMFGKHVPVLIELAFTFVKPKSVGKRIHSVVKPDLDKLVRGVFDALTGTVWADDAQCVEISARKAYGAAESVTIAVEEVMAEVTQ